MRKESGTTHCTKKARSARGEFLAVKGKPEAAEIMLKQEKEVPERAELIQQQEKVVL
ncbi:MAG: hypothetical protein QTN59_12990 [Candidatus Electrothrix communis]|nr:MAG: hypothetical protein QTN59_12990 [Candidatus Electrothrix communis]